MIRTTLPRSDLPGGLSGHRSGKGPPLVLIHGVGLRAEAWSAMLPELARDFAILAIDMPGHGGSALARTSDFAGFSARFDPVLLAHDRPIHIAGHSMGALIALDLARRHPGRVASVAALNGVFERDRAAAEAVRARAAALAQADGADPEPTLRRWFGDAPEGPDADAAAACRDWLTSCDPAGYAAAYRAFAAEDGPSRRALAALTQPALFITGALEPNSTPAMSRAMAGIAPRGQAVIVEGARHMMPMTHARETARHLQDFLLRAEVPA